MAFKLGIAVDLCMIYLLMLVSIPLNLMQGHSGYRQRNKFSFELSRKLTKQEMITELVFNGRPVIVHNIDFEKHLFIWLHHLVWYSLWF